MKSKEQLGGEARARSLSAEERSQISAEAAAVRWGIPKATHKGELHLSGIVLPCYVLEDGRRVLSQSGMMASLRMAKGSGSGRGDRLTSFATGKGISPYVHANLLAMIEKPIKFLAGSAGTAYGYEATILADLCDSILEARKAGSIQLQQEHIAQQAEMLIRSFAKVGIVALVDEATGYQEIRDRHALQAILDQYLRKEFAAWAKTFPDEFYQQIFRLRGWQWKGMKVNRPQVVAKYTNDLVYERLAPNILDELEKKNPRDEAGQRKTRHHQWLTSDIGHPALAQHLHTVVAFMRASKDWTQMKDMMNRALPRKGETLLLPF